MPRTKPISLLILTLVQFFPNFLRMHGKTYDFKMPYDSISRIFMLPKPDQQVHISYQALLYWTLLQSVFTILAVEPPLRQGNMRYPFLVMQVG